jgi:hypothetical protein
MGDDLEDDYVQGGDEYLSEGEDDLSFSHTHGDADVEGEGILPDAEGGSPAPVAGGKRKAGEEDVASDDSDDDDDGQGKAKPTTGGRELTEAERKKEKKRRNKEKLKEKKVRPSVGSQPQSLARGGSAHRAARRVSLVLGTTRMLTFVLDGALTLPALCPPLAEAAPNELGPDGLGLRRGEHVDRRRPQLAPEQPAGRPVQAVGPRVGGQGAAWYVRAGPELEPGSEAARSDIPWLTLLALASRGCSQTRPSSIRLRPPQEVPTCLSRSSSRSLGLCPTARRPRMARRTSSSWPPRASAAPTSCASSGRCSAR